MLKAAPNGLQSLKVVRIILLCIPGYTSTVHYSILPKCNIKTSHMTIIFTERKEECFNTREGAVLQFLSHNKQSVFVCIGQVYMGDFP